MKKTWRKVKNKKKNVSLPILSFTLDLKSTGTIAYR